MTFGVFRFAGTVFHTSVNPRTFIWIRSIHFIFRIGNLWTREQTKIVIKYFNCFVFLLLKWLIILMQSKPNNLRSFGSDGSILIPNETPDKTAPVFHYLRSNSCILMRLRSVTSRNWIMKLDEIDEVETVRIHFLSDVFGLISSRNFATMATWRNDSSFYSLTQLVETMQYQGKRVTA